MDTINDAKDELVDILNGEEYLIYYKQNSHIFSVWWEKIKGWLIDFLENLFPSLKNAGTLATPMLILIIVVVLLLIGIATFLLVRNRRRKHKFRDNTPLHSMKEMDWSYKMHVAEAMKQEGLEKFTPATRHLFLAVLLYFHEKEWLEARIWKTNWEYYEELKSKHQQSADRFYHFAHFFDEAMYGEQEVQKEPYIKFRTDIMNFLGDMDE